MPPHDTTSAFWRRVTLNAVWLHGGWEVIQCGLFYDVSGASPSSAFFFMAGATGADVILTLLLIAATLRPTPAQHRPATGRCFANLAVAGAVTATLIELLAWRFGWWHYSPAMPTLQLFGQKIGLLPVLQMALLPSLAFLLGRFPPGRNHKLRGTVSRPACIFIYPLGV